MSLLSVLASISGIAMALSNYPQAFKIFKRKSAHDIAVITFFILFFGSIIWIIYGISEKNLPIILSYSFGTTGIALVIIGWFLYGRK